jgi:NitT/TauT family transport system ATP-binding protein/nitrate/nitrite transport system substrate-binding protein
LNCEGRLRLGFVPLNDAAALIVARDKGFFAAEGLNVELSREASWATVRDKVSVGALDGAHMLAPLALAMSLGAGCEPTAMIAPFALNLGGAALTLSPRLAARVVEGAGAAGLSDLIVRRREQGSSPLTFAAVFPYSTHNYLLRDWLARAGVDPDRDVRLTVAPPGRTAELLADGVIEGFCAGEPWNRVAERAGAGQIVMRASRFAPDAPDKVFATTQTWAQAHPSRLQALLRALLRASTWIEAPENRAELVALLAHSDCVGVEREAVAASLEDIRFHRDGANRPEPSHALWLVEQMRRWGQLIADQDGATIAATVYRPDLFDEAQTALDA